MKTENQDRSFMIEITRIKLDAALPFCPEQMDEISWERRVKIVRYRSAADKKRNLTAELLMRICAHKALGIPVSDIQFGKNPYGRPYVPNVRHFHFNISHAGDYVAAAVARNAVGLDLEPIRRMDENVVSRYYTPAEQQYCLKGSEEEQNAAQTQIWTLKESYVKALGRGLSVPLSSFSFLMGEPICVMPDHGKYPHRFRSFFFDGHVFTVCYTGREQEIKIHDMEEAELYPAYLKYRENG